MEALIAVVVIVAAIAAIVLLRRRAGSSEASQSLIRFCIPLSDCTPLDPERLMSDFQERWGIKIGCEENPDWSNPKQQMRKYLLTDGQNMVIITTFDKPLPSHLRKITAEAAGSLTTEEQIAFMRHEGFAVIEYATGPDLPVENVRFAAMVLLSMLGIMPGTGSISIAGQLYQPMERLEPLMRLQEMEPTALFMLAVGMQNVYDDREVWLHTHGMEQFRLPDLEIRFTDRAKAQYYQELIGNASVYMMDQGPVMKPGHTCELAGDGIVYEIRAPRGQSRTHFGACGSLEIMLK